MGPEVGNRMGRSMLQHPQEPLKSRMWDGLGHNIYQLFQKPKWRGQIMLGKGLAPIDTYGVWILGWAWWGKLGNSLGRPKLPLVNT